jgi:hypothetical protein
MAFKATLFICASIFAAALAFPPIARAQIRHGRLHAISAGSERAGFMPRARLRQGRHPMVGGVWQMRRRNRMRAAISDEDAERLHLGSQRFNAILHGSEGGFAIASA